MQLNAEPILYEYAIVRYTPVVEREEFVNIGLIMMCKRRRWIKTAMHIDEERIKALFPGADIDMLRQQLESFSLVASGKGGTIGELETHERFRWLTAVRSACIGTSRPHPGLCHDLEATFDSIFKECVLTTC